MKPRFVNLHMDLAERISQMSYATRLQVGCVIVKENTILSYGWNGMPTGWDNACEHTLEDGSSKTRPETLHAETNALAKVARSTESSEGATLFCTHAPCMDCAKLIFQSGIKTIYYKNQYREDAGIKFLMISGVNVHQHPNNV